MEPALHDGDVVFVNKRAYLTTPPADGHVVVAHHPQRDFEIIKRVEFVDEGVYLRGDNRAEPEAQDSRAFGLVGLENVWGRVTSVAK